jgi:hypothetical protein
VARVTPDPTRDHVRSAIAARGLTPAAVTHLTRDALGSIDFAALAPVKKLLKRFFSEESWGAADDDALADLVGPGRGWWHYDLDDFLALEFGWRAGRFRLDALTRDERSQSFTGPVTPEATPNPRTIRFITPPIHDSASRWYQSAEDVDDPRVARLFAEFDDVANVLVGPTFVAVGLRHPDRWEHLLDAMLHTITSEFASDADLDAADVVDTLDPVTDSLRDEAAPRPPADSVRDGGALGRAWRELGSLQLSEPADVERLLSAVSATDAATRQVAARRLIEADAAVAGVAWEQLLGDPSRAVRRATVDAMTDAGRAALRPLLERALADSDAWTRWKALRGLSELGIEASRSFVAPLADDPDFRVRLEASAALHRSANG